MSIRKTLLALVALALFAPAKALAVDQPSVPVTVTIDSVTSVAGGPFSLVEIGGAPDFFARVNIDNSWLPDGPRIDNMLAIAPGWTFTRTVPRAVVPIRIELYDFDGLTSELVDVDAAVCPPSPVIGGGCATLSLGRPAFDYKGVDISLNVAAGVVIPVDATGDASSTSACTTGTEDQTATMCFTITTGAPNPILVTKRTDGLKSPSVPGTTFGVCTTTDCSLREALHVALPGDTIQLQALGHPYELTLSDPGDPFDPTDDIPGHLKIDKQNLKILGPSTGATIKQTQAGWRVFDVHGSSGVELRNLTITGGTAGIDDRSTALPGHKHGGGIHNHGAVKLVNVTLTDNHAPSGDTSVGGGGGFYNAGTATAEFINVTIADNDATVLGGGFAGNAAKMKNTLIANNSAPGGNCSTAPVDDGGNLQFPNATCGTAIPTAPKNPIGVAVSIGALVYLLPAGSPAIDAGKGTDCPTDDEIGEARPADGNGDGVVKCDAGATEYDPNGLGVIHQPLDSATGQTGPVELTFDNVTAAGTTTLTTSTTGPAPPAAYRRGSPSRYYDISTAAAFTGGVKVCIDYSGTSFANEADLNLFHRVGTSWQDKTVSLDTAANVICARTTSFSLFAIFQRNQKPVASIAEPAGGYSLTEGGSVVLQGSGSDADGDPLTYAWSPATDLDDPTKAAPTFSPRDDGNRTYTLTVSDPDASAIAAVTVRVANAAPTVSIDSPASGTLFRVGSSLSLRAPFADAGAADVHTCSILWDDGSPAQAGVVVEAGGAGTCSQTKVFAAAGVYTIQATVDDGDGGSGTASTMAVVYDPRAGSVTGGGTITSPAGGYKPNPTVSGFANFSFSALYQTAAATVPIGSTTFQLALPGLNLVSTSYEWLVVAGAKAQIRGSARINGGGNYGFLLTATDGQAPGGGGTDRFRIRIWDRAAGNATVYDNVLDSAATDDIDIAKPAPVAVGNVVILKGT